MNAGASAIQRKKLSGERIADSEPRKNERVPSSASKYCFSRKCLDTSWLWLIQRTTRTFMTSCSSAMKSEVWENQGPDASVMYIAAAATGDDTLLYRLSIIPSKQQVLQSASGCTFSKASVASSLNPGAQRPPPLSRPRYSRCSRNSQLCCGLVHG
jgi:hypothetical protein